MTPVIMCAICEKPVDSLEWWDDKIEDERVIVAKCHGDRDAMRLSFSDLVKMTKAFEPVEGVAFATKRVAAS